MVLTAISVIGRSPDQNCTNTGSEWRVQREMPYLGYFGVLFVVGFFAQREEVDLNASFDHHQSNTVLSNQGVSGEVILTHAKLLEVDLYAHLT